MPFQPGQAKPENSGRKVGSVNKKTPVKSTVKQWFIAKDVHPVDMIMETIREQKKLLPHLEPAEQVQAWTQIRKGISDLMPYMMARVKEQEDDGQAIDVTPEIQSAIQNAKPEDLIKIIHSIDNKE